MVSAWRNFKNIFSRPLFTIIFRPEMLKLLPYSILTGDSMVAFVIFCVLRISSSLLVFIRLLLQLKLSNNLMVVAGITVYVWLSMALDQKPLFLVDHKNRKCNFLCPFWG